MKLGKRLPAFVDLTVQRRKVFRNLWDLLSENHTNTQRKIYFPSTLKTMSSR
jgi:hypothetical protein